MYATTDNFLKRFKLNSIDELPDYDELMAQIAELNSSILDDEDDSNYLYKKDEYVEEDETAEKVEPKQEIKQEIKTPKVDENGYEIPDFLGDDDDLIKIQ
jgi:hypothetical protein